MLDFCNAMRVLSGHNWLDSVEPPAPVYLFTKLFLVVVLLSIPDGNREGRIRSVRFVPQHLKLEG